MLCHDFSCRTTIVVTVTVSVPPQCPGTELHHDRGCVGKSLRRYLCPGHVCHVQTHATLTLLDCPSVTLIFPWTLHIQNTNAVNLNDPCLRVRVQIDTI